MSRPSSSRASPKQQRFSNDDNNNNNDDDGMGEVDAFLQQEQQQQQQQAQQQSDNGVNLKSDRQQRALQEDEDDDHDDSPREAYGAPDSSYGHPPPQSTMGVPSTSRSQYYLPTSERLRGVANRIMFSRYYIIFYLAMTGLSLGTVILSLMEGGCPSTTWHILEVIVNAGMVLEVGTRWIGFGKEYPLTPLNILDLVLTLFCVITLLLVFLNPCGSGSKREEVLDTILLVVRNGVQFSRLLAILRRSGHSLLHPPRPIDLSQAREAALEMELDMDEEEAVGTVMGRSKHLGAPGNNSYAPIATSDERRDQERGETVFDANARDDEQDTPRRGVIGQGPGQVGYQAGKDQLNERDEEQWDRFS